MKTSIIFIWICRILAATIMLQTLYFKFSAAEESVFIFTQVGIEPWGRIATGIAELIAGCLILFPKTSVVGALMAIGIMSGAIISHLFILGIEVKNDGGQLFIYALLVLAAASYIFWADKQQLLKLLSKK
ncbi:MAG: DoxX family protein [Chitinophagaceae bacterium]